MNLRYSPGPWFAADDGTVRGKDYGDGVGNLIAQVALQEVPTERGTNARLISAAPELLHALESLRPFWNDLARAAIAKAHGQPLTEPGRKAA